MGTCWEVHDTLDNFINKLNKMRDEFGGKMKIQVSDPKMLSIPYERDEVDKGIQVRVEDVPLAGRRVVIRG